MVPFQPHDHLFHWVMAQPDAARALLRSLLPPDLVPLLDWSQLDVDFSRLDAPELWSRVPDAVCRIPLRDGDVLDIAIILEHQSGSDRSMPLRMLVSNVLVLTADVSRRRPPSVCIGLVLHHGERPWSSPRSVREYFDLAPTLDAVLGDLLPSHRYLLVDLAGLEAAALAAWPTNDSRARVMLFLLQRARVSKAIDHELPLIADDLRAIAAASDARQALTAVMRYLVATTSDSERIEPIRRTMRDIIPPEQENDVMGNILEESFARGEARGIARLRKAARHFLRLGIDRAEILAATELSDAELDEIVAESAVGESDPSRGERT